VQHVIKRILDTVLDHNVVDDLNKADAAHVKWMTEGESAYWACSDQFIDGVARGSRYYPRIISACLWMDHRDDEQESPESEAVGESEQ